MLHVSGIDPQIFPEIGKTHRVHAQREKKKSNFFLFLYFSDGMTWKIEKKKKKA